MNAKHEYEFLANYKVMQVFFKQKKIDKVSLPFPPSISREADRQAARQPIPVDKLVKCKMQYVHFSILWLVHF